MDDAHHLIIHTNPIVCTTQSRSIPKPEQHRPVPTSGTNQTSVALYFPRMERARYRAVWILRSNCETWKSGTNPTQKRFTDTHLNTGISFTYHAISIEERRYHFPVALWDHKHKGQNQTMQQRWFAGVHADVGGGYQNVAYRISHWNGC